MVFIGICMSMTRISMIPVAHIVMQRRKTGNLIYTGAIYDYTNGKLRIGKLSKSEMRKLWKTKGFFELVLKERLWYEATYHSDNPKRYPALPVIPFAQKRGKLKVCISHRRFARLQHRVIKHSNDVNI